jgi:PadR family transcriptional regulator PadR
MTTANEKRIPYQNRVELLQGTHDMLILQTLQWGQQHGYGISRAIRIRSGEVPQVETGSMYPALHRLERQGWVRSARKLTESNQMAKYYRITAMGKKQLASDHGRWQQMVEAIGATMSGELKSGEP